MSAQGIKIKDEQIEVVKIWPKLKSMRNIQVFLGFANFNQRFIQSFSKIAGLLTSMIQTNSTTRSSKNSLLSMYVESDKIVGGGGDCKDKTVKRSPRFKNSNGAKVYLTPDARPVFIQLKQAFTKAPIL